MRSGAPLPAKLVICSDMTRPNPDLDPNQAANAERFHEILREPLGGFFSEIELISTALGGKDLASIYRDVYGAVHEEPLAAWARHFDQDELPKEFVALLENAMQGALVAIFEPSPALVAFMERRMIPYVELRLHPARFLSDLLLWVRAGELNMNQRLRMYAASPDIVATEVVKRRGGAKKPLDIARDAITFLAQTSRDSSLILDGRFFELAQQSERLKRLCAGRRTVIKPHPYDIRSINARDWAELFPQAPWSNENLYETLASEPVLEFVTISSGAGFEAQAFGHRVTALSPRAPLQGSPAHTRFTPLLSAYWSRDFWGWVLGKRPSPPVLDPHDFIPSRLRRALGLSWSLHTDEARQ